MKAVILAAGKGERLGEITSSVPKPMIEFRDKPILQHNIELCRENGITDLYINVSHLAEKIMYYFGNGEKFGVNIHYSIEQELLGTSGAVWKIANDYWKSQLEEPFFVVYGDNFSNIDIEKLKESYNKTNALCTIAFHWRDDVSTSGVAEFDEHLRILKFIEKPKEGETESKWVNAGIYLLKPEILKFIPVGFSDFARTVFPNLINLNIPIFGVCDMYDVIAFDTREMFNKNINL